MLNLRTAFAILALATISSSTVAAQATDAEVARNADKYLTTRSEMGNYSGAVLIAKGNRIVFRKGYGFADLEQRIPYTAETKHAIASIAKMFTAMAALKLRDQGKLRLADKVCTYVDDCPAAWRAVTIDQLIHHTSGIPDYEEALELGSEKYIDFMRKPASHSRIISEMRPKPLEFTPGEKFKYSNTGYVLLARALSRVSGQPFAEFVRKEILTPAGMTQTGALSTTSRPANLAYGYTYGDIGWQKLLGGVAYSDGHMTKRPDLWFGAESGDGWLYSTLDDLHRWSRLMDGSAFVSPKLAAEIFTPKLEGYGFGWIVDSTFKRKRYHHTGSLPGYVSNFIKFPDDSVTIIIFANIDRGRMSTIVRDLTAITFGEPWDMPVRGNVVSLSAEQLSKLTGEYVMSNGTPLIIRVEDMLVAELKGRYTAGLIPLSPTEFYMPLGDGKAIFRLDSTGRAQEVNIRYSGLDRIARRAK